MKLERMPSGCMHHEGGDPIYPFPAVPARAIWLLTDSDNAGRIWYFKRGTRKRLKGPAAHAELNAMIEEQKEAARRLAGVSGQ